MESDATPGLSLMDLPSDLLQVEVLAQLDHESLANLMRVSRTLREEAHDERLWESKLFERWPRTHLLELATRRAGSHLALYRLKHAAELGTDPAAWREAPRPEVEAMVDQLLEAAREGSLAARMTAGAGASGLGLGGSTPLAALVAASSAAAAAESEAEQRLLRSSTPEAQGIPAELALPMAPATPPTAPTPMTAPHGGVGSVTIFLVDGSGSLADEEFNKEVEFAREASRALCAASPLNRVAVLQFSNEAQVELELAHRSPEELQDPETFGFARMNGGTDIGQALAHAAQIITGDAEISRSTPKTLVLLTDGRIDLGMAQQAEKVAAKMSDDLGTVAIFAVGVGRGVEKDILEKLIAARGCSISKLSPASRYLELLSKDNPW